MTYTGLILFALLAPAPAATPTPPPLYPLETLLAGPVRPGAIALLVPHLADDRATARVIEALSHSDPAVRGTAARVARVTEIKEAGTVLRRVLESESDASAATEQIHAVVALSSGADDRGLIPLAVKHGLIAVLGDALSGVRGPAALTLLPALREAGLPEWREEEFVAVATRGGREGLNVIAAPALGKGDAKRWASLLALARQPDAVMAPGLLLAAVRSPKPELRAAVYWHLASSPGARSPELDQAVAQAPESVAADTADPAAAFAFVVLKRAMEGRKSGGDWGDRAGLATQALLASLGEDTLAALLTEAEARAVSLLITNGRNAELLAQRAKSPGVPGVPEGPGSSGISFAGGLPPGTMRDMMAVTGCEPGAQIRATGFVEYRADGRPRRVTVAEPPEGRGCAPLAAPALGLSVAPRALLGNLLPAIRTVVVIPMNRAALDCGEDAEPPKAERVSGDGDTSRPGITEPRKVKNVAPWFTPSAREQRRQGVVILEAVISASGCIRSTRVLKGVAPDLDAVAMIAVGQWIYTPALLHGKPVPVEMRVTINFNLS